MTAIDKNFEVSAQLGKARHADAICRVVYLRPNLYSDESLTVGVIVSAGTERYLATVNSQAAYKILADLFGERAQEQLVFGLRALRSRVESRGNIAELISPTDMLHLGRVSNAACEDPQQFARDLLEISSSLYRNYQCKARTTESIGQEEITISLFNSVTHINALKASGLFKGRKIGLSKETFIKVPILGERIIGGPVSLVGQKVESAKLRAEAFIAQYSLAGKAAQRIPAIYILTPSHEHRVNQKRVDDSLHELKAVAEGLNVLIRHERSLPELAHALLRDEAA